MPARSFLEASLFEGGASRNLANLTEPLHHPGVSNVGPGQDGGNDVVVSGISCRLPQSDNMEEFKQNLLQGVDMVTEGDSRWKPGIYGLPKRSGKLKDLSKFDAAFFGVHPKQANSMDPQLRLLLEVSYEAIIDAGVNPDTVQGSRTGVFIGASASESHEAWSMDPESTVGYSMTGCTRSMFANRLSYFFDFKGPSYTVDTACSSSLLALDQALQSIRSGQCDAAIVGGANLCLKPAVAVQFLKLGMLSPDGMCKSFDADGNGYCRSEGIVAIYLQKEQFAKRVYCNLVHSKTNSDGNKKQGITFPSGEMQKRLLCEVYSEACINPADVAYIEAHGTGTKAGDPQEVNTICDVFCKGRVRPLQVGSVKSNMGHSEPASGLAAVAKVIVAMETNIIPANLHYSNPNPDIPGLTNGQLQVVDHNTQWDGGVVGVNSFGFGGANVHTILQTKAKSNLQCEGLAKKRLFVYCSRSEDGLKATLGNVRLHQQDVPLHALLNETAHMPASSHPYRGFTVLNGSEETHVQRVGEEKRPVWYVFAGMGTQWHGMGRDMMEIDIFKASILGSDCVLQPYGVKLYDLLMDGEENTFENTVYSFVAIAAIQVALVDMLKALGIRPDGILGHSVGELGCAYADGCLTAEETVLAAYWRGQCIQNAKLPPGGMAAVGLTWQEALEQCPTGVVPACHNAEDTVTVSGPREAVRGFVQELKDRQVFAKEVNSAGVAFHSYYMKDTASSLKTALDKVIKSPRPRTERWISSSIPEEDWSSSLAKFSSADYHVNNLVSPVLFQEALQHVPSNAIVIEIAPHCLLQAILKRSLSRVCCIVGLMKRGHSDNVDFCLSSLGRCYQHGLKLNPLGLIPPINFPVPQGTPMVSPFVSWDHSQSWNVATADMFHGGGANAGSGSGFDIDMSHDSEDRYLIGHKIDGRVLFPAAGYLLLAWKTLAKLEGKTFEEMQVLFEDVDIHRATILPDEGKVHFDVRVMPGTGNFEIQEGGTLVASGRVTSPDHLHIDQLVCERGRFMLKLGDIYKELRLRGYDYGPTFQGILGTDMTGLHGQLLWRGDWVSFLDTMLQMTILSRPGHSLCLPTRIKSLVVDPQSHLERLLELQDGKQGFDVVVDEFCDTCISGGVRILGLHATSAPRRHDYHQPVVEKYGFVPYVMCSPVQCSEELDRYVQVCSGCAFEGLTRLLDQHGNSELKNKILISSVLEAAQSPGRSDTSGPPPHSEQSLYLDILKEVFELNCDSHFTSSAAQLLREGRSSLMSDPLLSFLSQPDVLKPCFDLVVENLLERKLKILQISDSGMKDHLMHFTSSHPLLSMSYMIAVETGDYTQVEGAEIFRWSLCDKPPQSLNKAHLVIADNCLHHQSNVQQSLCNILECLDDGGFLLVQEYTQNFHVALPVDSLVREDIKDMDLSNRSFGIYCTAEKWREIFSLQGLEIIFERSDSFLNTVFLLRKRSSNSIESQEILCITDMGYSWVHSLKEKVQVVQSKPKGDNLWLIADNSVSGIVGMVNCLRQEPGGDKIRCILNTDNNPMGDYTRVVQSLLEKDLVMNVCSNGTWGSFRHLTLQPGPLKPSECSYLNVQTKGDLSSLHWIESPLRFYDSMLHSQSELCKVHFSSLNFRDVMLATGKLPPDAIPGGIANQECMLGMEFSGTDSRGNRVMGLVPAKGLATVVDVSKHFLWSVPDHWTLEEAATIPVVYTTAYYALVVRGNLHPGDKVLIHSGSGGVGQAAISIALSYGCTVYTTVGSKEKKEYLRKRFPQLVGSNFFNSRDVSFEADILKATKGKGVDIVLNSLAEEKLQASIRVLAQHGRFLEIGKFDLSNNTALGMSIFLKNISFHGILLDALFEEGNHDWETVSRCLTEGIQSGAVKPLNRTVFEKDDVEAAFRFMAQGKHIGKVLVKIQQEDQTGPVHIPSLPRLACDPRKSYIITGGLGGFGLELAHWLVDRGATSLILTSRSGIRTGYQARKINFLRNQGVDVVVSTRNVTSIAEVEALLTETCPKPVGGVFHLAMVLKDGYLENQDTDSFLKVCEPKVTGTINLDRGTRQLCESSCDWFVVFSSVSCGRGNAGQSNYGFANSVMERVCEQRRKDGLHGLAVQWGAIGDVGIVLESMGDNDTVIGGTLPQRITSCLATLDIFLNQSEPVVSSFIPALKEQEGRPGGESKLDLVLAVCHILGISEPTSVNPDATLGDLGLDSMMSVEVKQTLERGFDQVLSTKDIRLLTVNKLRAIMDSTAVTADRTTNNLEADQVNGDGNKTLEELVPSELIVKMNTVREESVPLYIIHPIEGSVGSLKYMSEQVSQPVFGVQCTREVPDSSIHDMAAYYLKMIIQHNKSRPFHLAGYSFGACVAIEIALQVDQSEHMTQSVAGSSSMLMSLTLLDGSHRFVAAHTETYREQLTIRDGCRAESVALCNFLEKFGVDNIQSVSSQLMSAASFSERLDVVSARVVARHPGYLHEDVRKAAEAFYCKLMIGEMYTAKGGYSGDIQLIAAEKTLNQKGALGKDYGLHEVCSGAVKVYTIPGDHETFLQGESGTRTAEVLNRITSAGKLSSSVTLHRMD